ncbi:uncharacterized protein EDB93DRAFT_1106137 [Suillus bovinus]|uniref:uncharacterized protein n=1 Tax=Suillus bovinus TaxID=48563 RepID=UPI001B87A157|nr:uncharacterized protein EDB93DRAFT_1106137 [Suillus bovinus]KAG2139160.1 hypothetical protein EDB93DRAFT_1106137 [Suillus bovinus]
MLTVAQKKDRIHSIVLKDEEIGVMIEEDRGRDWGHVKWARKVSHMAQGFNDTQCHLLDAVLENTPKVLCDFLDNHYNTWAEFEADVAKISASQLRKAKQWLVQEHKLQEDIDKLQNQVNGNCKNPASPSQNNQTPYVPPPACRYSYCYGTPSTLAAQPQATTPLQPVPPPTTFQNPQMPVTLQILETPQASNLFLPMTPITQGNLFYGYRGFPQTPTRAQGGSLIDRACAAAQYVTITHQTQRQGNRSLVLTPSAGSPTNVQFVTPATGPPASTQYVAPTTTMNYPQYPYYPQEAYNPYDDPSSPNLSDITFSLPSTVPTSTNTSDFNTSVINLPMGDQTQMDNQDADENLVDSNDSLLDMNSDSDSNFSSALPFSDSDSVLISAPTFSGHSSVTFSSPDIVEPISNTEESDPEIPASIDSSTSTTESVLSVISTPKSIQVADCYQSANDQNVTDLHNLSDQCSHIKKANYNSEVPSQRIWTGMFKWNKAKI